MAVLVSGSGVLSLDNRCRYPLRFASGIPVVGFGNSAQGQIILSKGNAVSPTSFSLLFNQAGIPDKVGHNTWVMIGSNLAMCGQHISSGMTVELRQWTVNEVGTNNGGALIVALDALPSASEKVFDTAVDSNGALHVIYTDSTANMGTSYLTLYYINNVGGSWNTRVEVYGAGSTANFANERQPSIIIDSANLPIVSSPGPSGTNTWKRGNANNATSFENRALSAGATYGHNTVGCDIRGNHYVFAREGAGDLRIDKHASGASWATTTNTTFSNKEFDFLYGVKIQGDYAYVVFKDQTNNANGVSIAKIDISGTTPTYVTTLERTSDDWFEWEATFKNSPLYHNYDKNGIDVGVSALAKEIDLPMNLSDGGSLYDAYWENFQIAPTIALNTADLTDFTDTTPTLEQTGDEIFDLDTLEYDVQVMTDNLAVVDSFSDAGTTYTQIFGGAGVGQSFTGDGKYLTRISFDIYKSGTITGVVRAYLYAHSGTYGTSSVGTGSPLAISSAVDISTITGTFAQYNFDFDGSFQLENGTKYVCIVKCITGTGGNEIRVKHKSGGTHSGNYITLSSTGTWASNSGLDTTFVVNGHTLLLDRSSDVDTNEFVNTVTGGDTHPFNDAEKIAFTVDSILYDEFLDDTNNVLLDTSSFAFGQSFQGTDADLNHAWFSLYKNNLPTGNAVAKLYAHSGTYGSTSLPTGTALATSDTFDVSTLTATRQWIKFTFSTPYTMSSGTNYVIVLEYTGATASNTVGVRVDNTTPTHSGNGSRYTTSWATQTWDLTFKIETSIELSVATYYWRARARSGDLTGYWSAIRSFDIIVISSNVSKIKVTAWKDWAGGQINIGGTWKTVTAVKINIGGVWKDADIVP